MKRITVALQEDAIERIQTYADRRGLSFSAAVRCILSDAQEIGLIAVPKLQDGDKE